MSCVARSVLQVPNMIVMAPSDEVELIHMVATAAGMDRHPICFRFPRGNALGLDLAAHGIVGYKGQPLEVCPADCSPTSRNQWMCAVGFG